MYVCFMWFFGIHKLIMLYLLICFFFNISSSCGSLSTAILGPMVLGPSISIDDWVPELPPKKKQSTISTKREPSPDLPPPPPIVDDEQLFVSDEPLPPPPPPEAIWPKPESLKNDKYLRNSKEKRLESSFSAVEDVLLNRDIEFNNSGSYHGHNHSGSGGYQNHHHGGHHYNHYNGYQNQHRNMSEKSKSLSYIFDDTSPKTVPQTPVKTFAVELQLPPFVTSQTNGCDDKQNNSSKEFGRSSSVRRNKLTIPNKDFCKSEFSARKSVFQGGSSTTKQMVMSTVKPPAFNATTTTVQNIGVKHQICTPLKIVRDTEKKSTTPIRSPSSIKSGVIAGPLKSSGVFPLSLEPNCPPTLYQQ